MFCGIGMCDGSPGLLVPGHGAVAQPLPVMFEHDFGMSSSTMVSQSLSLPSQNSACGVHVVQPSSTPPSQSLSRPSLQVSVLSGLHVLPTGHVVCGLPPGLVMLHCTPVPSALHT